MESTQVIKLGWGRCCSIGSVQLKGAMLKGKEVKSITLRVIDRLSHQIILGLDVLCREQILIDTANSTILFKENGNSLSLLSEDKILDNDEDCSVEDYEFTIRSILDLKTLLEQGFTDNEDIIPDAGESAINNGEGGMDKKITEIIQQYPQVFKKVDILLP